MSFEEDNTRAFQQLIATQPQLFYKHEAELHQLLLLCQKKIIKTMLSQIG